MSRKPQLGRVPDGRDPNELRRFLQAVKDIVEAEEGIRGASDMKPTVRQLIDAGVLGADRLQREDRPSKRALEIAAYRERTINAAASTTYVCDLSSGNVFDLVITAATTLNFSLPDVKPGKAYSFTLISTQDSGGGNSWTWPSSVIWTEGAAPTQTTTANAIDIYTFFTTDGGSTWFGFQSGRDMQ